MVAAMAGDSSDSDSSSDTPYNQAQAASNLGANTGYMDTSTSSSDTQLDVASSSSSDSPPSKHARTRGEPWDSNAVCGYKYTNCSSSSDSDNFSNNKSHTVSNNGTTISSNVNASSCSYTSDTESSTDSDSSTSNDDFKKRTFGKPNKAFEQSRKCNKDQGVSSANKQLDMSFSSISFTSDDSLFDWSLEGNI